MRLVLTLSLLLIANSPFQLQAGWNPKDWVQDLAGEADRALEEAQRLAREAEARAREAASKADAESRDRATQASNAATAATQRAAEATDSVGQFWERMKTQLPTDGSVSPTDLQAFKDQAEKARASLQEKWGQLTQQLDQLAQLDPRTTNPSDLLRSAQQQAQKALAAVKDYRSLLAQIEGLIDDPSKLKQTWEWFKRLPFTDPLPAIRAFGKEGITLLLTYLVGFWLLRRVVFGGKRR